MSSPAFDPMDPGDVEKMRISYGITPRQLRTVQNLVDPDRIPNIPAGLPVADTQNTVEDWLTFANGGAINYDGTPITLDQYYSPVDPAKGTRQRSLIPPSLGKDTSAAPAPMSEIPTSTINPARPRTVAAGYDPSRQTITVIFRDGTYYNYYQVPGDVWANFKRAYSKGRYIKTYLDGFPRGKAAINMLSQTARGILYQVTRTSQVARRGLTGSQTEAGRQAYERRHERELAKQKLMGQTPTGAYRKNNLGGNTRRKKP